jgi:hypothetical protein
MRGGLLFERTEIVVGPELESDSRAFRPRALAQDHGIACIREIDHVALFGDQREPKDVRVIVGLDFQLGRLVARMGYLSHSHHSDCSLSLRDSVSTSSQMAACSQVAEE